jgi:nucleoside 2-deoxyribosyltransferase
MKKIKIYLAGPLFIQSEIDQRKAEAKKLRELGYEVYSPIEQNEVLDLI